MMEFFLFDVQHGQSAAIRLPNGRWCLFDAGAGRNGSPTAFIRSIESSRISGSLLASGLRGSPAFDPFQCSHSTFQYLKATISHLHHDHLSDWENMLGASPVFLRTVDADQMYFKDLQDSSDRDSYASVRRFWENCSRGFGPAVSVPDYGGIRIYEDSLPVAIAREVGGDANSRVNNASVITRINCYGNSILLCGDMEKEAWDFVLNPAFNLGRWKKLVSNVDLLVVPHHGHCSAYSASLMALAKPTVVLVSVKSYDLHVDERYSSDSVAGITFGANNYKRITTRKHGTIKVVISPPESGQLKGRRTWTLNHPVP